MKILFLHFWRVFHLVLEKEELLDLLFGDLITRPKEGDLIYFPLGERLFEIKRVEHEKPFYQLGSLYTYDLSCELFEYENEFVDTSIAEIDNQLKDEGYITTINLVGVAQTATATVGISSGRVTEIFLNNDGSGFTSAPTVTFSAPPDDPGSFKASAVAITTQRANVTSVLRLEITNAGAGYTEAPTITISGGGGAGAAATCSISTTFGIQNVVVGAAGTGYSSTPTLTVTAPPSGINTAVLNPVFNASIGAGINTVRILNSGIGYIQEDQLLHSLDLLLELELSTTMKQSLDKVLELLLLLRISIPELQYLQQEQ